MTRTNADMDDANPDAVTQIANGTATTTLSYDNNGNLTSAGTSTFNWDYNNRMTQAVTGGSATSTYSYDYAGNRVSQVVGSTTTVYPNKYYSVTSSVSGATTTATTTVYVWNGNTLIATIDQVTVNGTNSGTSSIRYIHPDNLGSTNIVSDESGNNVADYETYPYGETRLNQTTYPTKENRRFIGQFSDANNLQYLNARYLNSQQGQFLSEDPVFLGDPSQQNLQDPQSLNTYTYANDNPINKSDPQGLWAIRYGVSGTIPGWGLTGEMGIQTDFRGLEFYYGAGLAGGGGVTIGPAFTTAELWHQYSITTSALELPRGMLK
jgi:RHS repeat-associated protein